MSLLPRKCSDASRPPIIGIDCRLCCDLGPGILLRLAAPLGKHRRHTLDRRVHP